MSATRSLFERRDVIIVASVSCIYGLGSPEAYYGMMLMLEKGQQIAREAILRKLRGDSIRTLAKICAAAHFACAEISSKFIRLTKTRVSHRNVGQTRSTPSARSIRSPEKSVRGEANHPPAHLSEDPLRYARRTEASAPSAHSTKNWSGGSRNSRSRANTSKRSAMCSAPCSISK